MDHNWQPVVEQRFATVDDLPPPLQMLVSCSFLPDLERVKRLVPRLLAPAAGGFPGLVKMRAPGVGFTALDWAARKGHFDIAEFLVTDPRTRAILHEGTPIAWGCYTDKVDLCKMLLAHGADPRRGDVVSFSTEPLFLAAENGSR